MFICLLKNVSNETDNIFLNDKLKFSDIFCTMNRLWEFCLSKHLKYMSTLLLLKPRIIFIMKTVNLLVRAMFKMKLTKFIHLKVT